MGVYFIVFSGVHCVCLWPYTLVVGGVLVRSLPCNTMVPWGKQGLDDFYRLPSLNHRDYLPAQHAMIKKINGYTVTLFIYSISYDQYSCIQNQNNYARWSALFMGMNAVSLAEQSGKLLVIIHFVNEDLHIYHFVVGKFKAKWACKIITPI